MKRKKTATIPAVKLPSLRFHTGKRLFRVTLSGRDIWLGSDKAQAERRYHAAIAEWVARGKSPEPPPKENITIVEMIDLWHSMYADAFYRNSPGSLQSITAVLKDFSGVYGRTSAATFGPKALKAYRAGMCDGKLSRTTVNQKIKAIRRVFVWAASEELIPVDVPQSLQCVEGLRAGRALGVKEPQPIRAAKWEHVEAVLPYMPAPVADLMRLCWHTGARIGELVNLRASDIDKSAPIWTATITAHKTAYAGRTRRLYFGAKAQSVLKPAMLAAPFGRVLFSPWDSIAERADAAQSHRRDDQQETPRKTDRTVTEAYDPRAVNRAVTRAIVKCNADPKRADKPKIPHWHPHMLRHAFATRVRAEIGLEAASVALGHSDLEVTKLYAEVDGALAAKVAAMLG